MEDELPSCTASPSPTCGLPAAAVIAATQTPDMTSGPRLGHCSGRIACQDEALGWSNRLLSSTSCPSDDILAFCTRLHGYVSMSIARVFCPSSSIQLSIMTKCFDLGFGLSVPSVQCVPASVTFAPVVSVNHDFSDSRRSESDCARATFQSAATLGPWQVRRCRIFSSCCPSAFTEEIPYITATSSPP
jgi:hypothetical protein